MGGEGTGGDESEGWSGESGGSDATSDAESWEGEEEHSPFTASPWGTQESGGRGILVGVRASGSGGGKVTSRTADRGRRGAAMGCKNIKVVKGEAAGVGIM